jgi:hypothetical protein
MKSRKRVNKDYYEANKILLQAKRRAKYDANAEVERAKERERYFMKKISKRGRVIVICKAIKKYQHNWKLKMSLPKKIADWSMLDPDYERIFTKWVSSCYSKEDSPVLMRRDPKQGWIIGNIYWAARYIFPWWRSDLAAYKKMYDEIDNAIKAKLPTMRDIDKKAKEVNEKAMQKALKAQRAKEKINVPNV